MPASGPESPTKLALKTPCARSPGLTQAGGSLRDGQGYSVNRQRLVLLGASGQIVEYFDFVAVVFLDLCVFGIFRLDDPKRPSTRFRVPGYPYTPLAFIVPVVAMLFLRASKSPLQALLGVLVALAGVPVFRLVQKRCQ